MKKFSLIFGALFFSTYAMGEITEGEILLTSRSQRKAVIRVNSTYGIRVGGIVNLGVRNCLAEVTKRVGHRILVKAKYCENTGSLYKGNRIVLATRNRIPASNFSLTGGFKGNDQGGDPSTITQGVRLSVGKSFFSSRMEFSSNTTLPGTGIENDYNSDFLIGAGYAYIREMNIGFTATAMFNQFSANEKSVRGEANATFGFYNYFYALAGLNVHHYITSLNQFVGAGIGYQAGVGFQLNKNFGLDLKYVVLNNEGTESSGNVDLTTDLTVKGLEMVLHGTF